MKKPTDKLATNLGHNNPPAKIESIDFVNLKVYNNHILI
jgi:hypothetical protein